MKRRLIISESHNYEAAYKKAGSGELLWISCAANDSKEADILMDKHVATKHATEGYRRYAGSLLIEKQFPTTA